MQSSRTASIVIQLRRDELTAGQVRAIRNFVASATPGLSANRVTIVDETGRLLAAAQSGEEGAADGIDARQVATEDRIRRTVTDIVEGIVGQGNARVQVTADMDFNRVSETTQTFDPEGRVVRSTQTSEETGRSGETSRGTTAGANVPDANASASQQRPAERKQPKLGNGQLRDLEHHAHRSERRRPHPQALGRGRGQRRHDARR